ncbi:hypothetical protein VPH35_018268 [Triticum aestivum]
MLSRPLRPASSTRYAAERSPAGVQKPNTGRSNGRMAKPDWDDPDSGPFKLCCASSPHPPRRDPSAKSLRWANAPSMAGVPAGQLGREIRPR